MAATDDAGPGRGRGIALLLVLVLLAALVPSLGTLDAGLISEDGAALAYVDRHGPLADLTGPQYDLRTFRFWRPLVTAGLDLQQAVVGQDPVGLRLFNLACHALSAVLLTLLALALGVPRAGALAAGVLAALFPFQGGTVTWIIGRTEVQTAPWILGCLLALARERRWWAAACCALALASKENAAVLPALAAVVVAARRWSAPAERRPARPLRLLAPTLVTFAAVFALRASFLGHWIGGYPGGLSGVLDGGAVALLTDSGRALAGSSGWLLVGLVLALAAAVQAGRRAGDREPLAAVLVGGACLLLALAPLVTYLAPGSVDPAHERTLWIPELFGCLAVGAGLGAAARLGHAVGLGAGVLVLVLAGQRAQAAWTDTHDWATAGREAEHLVQQGRQLVAGLAPSDLPVLVTAPPPALNGCYVLKFGVPDRFRAPFPASPRPVWPWGPVFEVPGQAREAAVEVVDHLRLPLDTGPTLAPELALRLVQDGAAVEALRLDGPWVEPLVARAPAMAGQGPTLELLHERPSGTLEALVFTEQGYAVAVRGAGGPVQGVHEGRLHLVELLNTPLSGDDPEGQRLLDALAWAADLGATEAWLELRLVGADGELLAASRWVPLTWGPGLRDRLLPWDSF